jgi:hypothetical protein
MKVTPDPLQNMFGFSPDTINGLSTSLTTLKIKRLCVKPLLILIIVWRSGGFPWLHLSGEFTVYPNTFPDFTANYLKQISKAIAGAGLAYLTAEI